MRPCVYCWRRPCISQRSLVHTRGSWFPAQIMDLPKAVWSQPLTPENFSVLRNSLWYVQTKWILFYIYFYTRGRDNVFNILKAAVYFRLSTKWNNERWHPDPLSVSYARIHVAKCIGSTMFSRCVVCFRLQSDVVQNFYGEYGLPLNCKL